MFLSISSWFNDAEMESVLHYVDKLLNNQPHKIKPSDIGIIAAYKRQVFPYTNRIWK